MIRIAVCDDDPMYLSGTEGYLQKWQQDTGFTASVSAFDNGDALLEKAAQNPFDIILLDIMMPMLNGIDAAKELRIIDKTAKIVFLTTSPEFALDSYAVRAANYLVKPVPYARFKPVLDELVADIIKEPKSLMVKTIGGYRKVYLHDIEYLEASNKKVLFCFNSGKSLESPDPLYLWEKLLLPADGFYKCHRSYLVNIVGINFFDSTVIHTKSGKTIPIARGYAKNFEAAYFSGMFPE